MQHRIPSLDRFSGQSNEARTDTTTEQESKRFRTKWKERTNHGDHQMNKHSIFKQASKR